MSYNLFIIESPGKIKKISQILGSKFKVVPTIGHITCINTKGFNLDLKTFEPKYSVSKAAVIKTLKEAVKSAKTIYIATDPDRAGERIANDVVKNLNLKNYHRITFNEITSKGINNAIKNPRLIDNNLLNAQRAQESLDYLIGLKISPEIGKIFGDFKLSAGRCMSVYTKLIYDKEKEIENFYNNSNKNINYKVSGLFTVSNPDIKNIKGEYYKELTKDELLDLLNNIKSLNIDNIKESEHYNNPSAPFTTLAMQKRAASLYGFTSKKTMMLAQTLYENGKISYMRTDNTTLPEEILNDCEKYINEKYPGYHHRKQYENKSKNAQEGHSAIYPIHIEEVLNEDSTNHINKDCIKLYNMIVNQTIASQMKAEKVLKTSFNIIINNDNQKYFKSGINQQIFNGYKIIYQDTDNEDNNINSKTLLKINKDSNILYNEIKGYEYYENAPGRYSESSFITQVEKLEIGRPSTMAMLINKIQEKGYVEKQKKIKGFERTINTYILKNNKIEEKQIITKFGEESNKFIITELGIKVTELLNKYFKNIMDYKFTADMEYNLTKIANGKLTYFNALNDFYNIFKNELEDIIKYSNNIKESYKEETIVGNYGGNEIKLKTGKYGKYIESGDKKISLKNTGIKIKKENGIETITEEDALELLNKNDSIGEYNGYKIELKTGRYGKYIKWNNINISYKDEDIDLNKIIELIEKKLNNNILSFKDDKYEYNIINGPYGLYIQQKGGKGKPKNIKIPKKNKDNDYIEKINNKTLTLEDIKTILKK